jgi:hypothetical protein
MRSVAWGGGFIVLIIVLAYAGQGCLHQVDPAADPVDVAPTATTLPYRVWWRCDADKSGPTVVSDRPGGDPLPGRWDKYYFCGMDGSPSGIWLKSDDASRSGAAGRMCMYNHTWAKATREGTSWRLYSRGRPATGDALTEEERRLVGRWRHHDGHDIELRLLSDGTGRGADGSVWEWLAAEDFLELRKQLRPNEWLVQALQPDADRRGYMGVHEPEIVGTLIESDRAAK